MATRFGNRFAKETFAERWKVARVYGVVQAVHATGGILCRFQGNDEDSKSCAAHLHHVEESDVHPDDPGPPAPN